MVNKTREEEEKYFQRVETEKRLTLRRQRQLEAVRQKEREGIASALNTNEELAEEAMNLGFDTETARLLPLIPMIQVAWADGSVSGKEHDEVEAVAERFGIAKETSAHEFLLMLLNERPTDVFFERVNRVIRHLVSDDRGMAMGENILQWSKEVAAASGGFFGLSSPISKEEQAVLDEFADLFDVST